MRIILKFLAYSIPFFIVLLLWAYFRYDDWQWKNNILQAVFWGIFVPSYDVAFKKIADWRQRKLPFMKNSTGVGMRYLIITKKSTLFYYTFLKTLK